MPDLDRELETARGLALAAGAILLRHRAGAVAVAHKARGEVVTAADVESDAAIRSGITAAFPDDVVFSEEALDPPGREARPRLWIVDPLDGTSTFIAGGDAYAVSIGLAVEGEAVVGAVYVPARAQLFTGSRGRGVTLNGAPVRASDVTALGAARVTVSPKERDAAAARLGAARSVHPLATMSHKLARVAAGLDDAAVSLKDRKEWGTCAGVALVLAAGGRATHLDGRPIAFNRAELRQSGGLAAAGSERLHQALLAVLGRAPIPGIA